MAQSESHAPAVSSNNLSTLSSKARTRATILRRLADDLLIHDDEDTDGDMRLVTVVDVLLHGTGAELNGEELQYLLRLDVPRVLVAGDTRER